jgi:phage antirepressor YoqD-like protein
MKNQIISSQTAIIEKTMAVSDIAKALGVSYDSANNAVKRCFPTIVKNGIQTKLNEKQVAYISRELKQNTQVTNQMTFEAGSKVKNTQTELEILDNAMKAMIDLQNLYNLKESEYKEIIARKDARLIEQQPKADFYDAVAESKDAIDIGKVAKVLNIGIGRNRLFETLRNKHILQNNNVPYQKYIDAGYFRVIEQKYMNINGTTHINVKTLVYQRGVDFIRKICIANNVITN